MSDREARIAELANKIDGGPEPDQPEVETSAPDDGTGAPETEAEQPETPEGGADEFDFDISSVPEDADRAWLARRHKEMQGLLTKKTQALAEERRELAEARAIQEALKNPDKHPELLAKLGYELEDEDDEFDYETEPDPQPQFARDPRFDEFLQQQAAQQAEQARLADIEEQIEELEAEVGQQFEDADIQLIADLASFRSGGDRPDIKGAYKALKARDDARLKGYVKSKKAEPAPKGESATHTPDLSTEEARARYIAERVEALEHADS